MTATHATKKSGLRYCYYVSRPLIASSDQVVGSLSRIPAGSIESLVEREVVAALLAPEQATWPNLNSEGRANRVRAIVRRVTLKEDAVVIEMDEGAISGTGSMSGRAYGGFDPSKGKTRLISVPVRMRRNGGMRLLDAQGSLKGVPNPLPDRSLIKALVRAHSRVEAL
jgi:hypothetical protein